jgi:2-amino-4-hydroxy-6-hydroxymethyldihydropteridine diphosphokinase
MPQKEIYYKYIISIGSNSAGKDRAVQNIRTAFNILTQKFEAVVFSGIIPTRAVDTKVDCQFFNAVVSLQTPMQPAQLKSFLKETESKMGRIPCSEEVIIDMDIILVNGKVVHKDYENRAFIRELIETIGL